MCGGDVAGLGFGMMYLPAVVAVPFYIKKWRTLGIAVALGGSGIGTSVFKLLTEILMLKYSWRGAFVIEAAILSTALSLG